MARSRRIMVFAALIIAVSLIEKGMSAQQKRSQTAKETKADVLKNLKVGDEITAKVYEGDFHTLYDVHVVPPGKAPEKK